MSVNKVILIGNTGHRPSIKTLDGGLKTGSFTLATSERGYTLQNGTQVPEKIEWHNIVVWKALAELAEKWIYKGSKIYIEGKLQTKSWDKDGVKHYRTEILAEKIQLIEKKPEAQQQQAEQSNGFQKPVKVDMPDPVQSTANLSGDEEKGGMPF